jgi:hypothetical protein
MRWLKRWILAMIGIVGIQQAVASSRSFPWLTITPRSERWADESWRYFSAQGYKNRQDRTKIYTDWLAGSGTDSTGDFAKRKEREEINEAREEFLHTHHPEELVVDGYIREVEGKYLLRWLWFHRAKTKIVLHHTVTPQVTTYDGAKASLQQIYKQHTVTQGWGDIWYNFLLDPMGTIYEGRYGGKDVIGAHADRNNTRTIGVAMLGNYDVHHPSPRMRRSLKKLLFGLVIQYGIDPFEKQTYFTPIAKEPRLTTATHTSLVGHSDTKNTACPGIHVEDLMPALRNELSEMYETVKSWKKDSIAQFRFLPKKLNVWMSDDRATTTYSLPNRIIRDCKLFGDGWVSLTQCGGDGENLIVTVMRETNMPSGPYALLVDTDAGALWIDMMVVREAQLHDLLKERQRNNPLTPKPASQIEKMEIKTDVSATAALMTRQIGVLLYEPTTSLDLREMQCESGCAVQLDDQRFTDVRLVRVQQSSVDSNRLTVFLDLQKYDAWSIHLFNPRSVITITNWSRGSAQFPLNYFRGDIAIQREAYVTVDKKEQTGWTVVNHVPVELYIRGIAETIESQHPEKLRAMALLIKGYTLFYLWGNRHPSVPEGVSYQAIDDPRLFQKYVGAGIEQTMTHRQQAVEKTKNQAIAYDGYLPILPFFHCSAGFIRGGNERFGWTDTPWLVAKLDLATCESGGFEWHGVGLSGDGAERLAQAWATYAQIIEYYYPGVEIRELGR